MIINLSKSKILAFFLFIILLIPQSVFALTNGILATDLLGQYDQTSFTDPVPVYTKDRDNDGPNKFGLSSPKGSVVDVTNHRFFVADANNSRVLVYNLNSDNTFPDRVPDYVLGQSNFYDDTGRDTQSGLSYPNGLAYDSINNRLFVAEELSNRVKVFDVTAITDGENAVNVLGQADFVSRDAADTQGGLNRPTGLAYDSTNSRLFIAELYSHRVKVFDVTAITDGENAVNVLGQADFTASGYADTQSGLNYPEGLAYDSTNSRLFVAEGQGNRVKVFNVTAITDGENAVNVLGQADFVSNNAADTQAGLNYPNGLFYNPTNSRLFVAEKSGNRVKVFDVTAITDGENAVNVLGQPGFVSNDAANTQSGLNGPVGFAYDSTNSRLFVAEDTGHRVKIFDITAITDGENAVDLLGQYDQTSFTDPVPVYTKNLSNDGPNKFGFDDPEYIALDSTNHRLFVADNDNNRVLVYNLNSDNTFLDRIPDYVLGQSNFYDGTARDTQSGLKDPRGLAYDSTNNHLFVAEGQGNRVKIFDITAITNGENSINVLGQADFTTSDAADTQAGLNEPTGLAYDSTNSRLFVSEANGNRVKVFNVTAITDGENAINVLGQADFTANSSATTQAGMNSPRGLAYDSSNSRLFVAERSNTRVTIWNVASIIDGEDAVNVLGQNDFVSSDDAVTAAGFDGPIGVAYDPTNDRLFVSDYYDDHVKAFDVSAITNGEDAINVIGQVDFTSEVETTTRSGIDQPIGLAYDIDNDRLFVVDSDNSRVLLFDLSTNITNTSATSGFFSVGSLIQIIITFSDPVTVTGTPTLTLNTGRTASYTSGTGTSTLTFNYTVIQGEYTNDLDYSSTSALSLSGGTIIDPDNNNVASLTLPSPGSAGSISYTSNSAIPLPAAVILPSGGFSAPFITNIQISPVVQNNIIGVPVLQNNTPISQQHPTCADLPSLPKLLRRNTIHSSVKILQQILNCKGYVLASTGPGSLNNETTKFGPLTQSAVLKFQKEKGLDVDGIVGDITRGELNK